MSAHLFRGSFVNSPVVVAIVVVVVFLLVVVVVVSHCKECDTRIRNSPTWVSQWWWYSPQVFITVVIDSLSLDQVCDLWARKAEPTDYESERGARA